MQKKNVAILLLIIALFALFALDAVANTKKEGDVTVTGSIVNVRSGPSISDQVIGQVVRGNKLQYIKEQDEWVKIKLRNGKTGWIAGWLVEVDESVEKEPSEEVEKNKDNASFAGKGTVTGSYVNIRSGPGIDNKQISRVHRGQILELVGKSEDWYQVVLANSQKGWIAGWLVELIEENESSEQETTKEETAKEEVQSGEDNKTRYAVITASAVNVRQGPDISYQRIGRVVRGDELAIVGTEDDWIKVQLDDNGASGWIAGWLANEIEKEIPKNDEPKEDIAQNEIINRYTIIQVEEVSLRSGPGTSYEKIEIASQGQEFLLVKQDGDWYQVQIDDHTKGWVASWLVSLRSTSSMVASRGEEGAERKPNETEAVDTNKKPLSGKIIVIDPGHGRITSGGWSDPGAIGPTGLKESDVATDISHRLKDLLEEKGAQIVMTRTGDTTHLSLADRAELANNAGGDIFVSIHANASLSPWQNGTSTWYYAPLNSDLGGQRSERRALASAIQAEMVKETGLRNMGIIEENFSVLRNTKMPSVLVETAFISNPEEERLLASSGFRQQCAEAIAGGINLYFAQGH
ncbi:N-acetylmuramoyl-L-alanine amidase [Desulfitispora alkaliphila]|uniref:SH3 domain-containing protein n=1 Tax=Desulfitispora alkaliphila TaxID=622674 RepID=UPI003D1E04FB